MKTNPKCKVCGLTHPAGSREATRDFVFIDVCIKHGKEECAHQFNIYGTLSRSKRCVKCGFITKEN